jgi:hypothetical protein
VCRPAVEREREVSKCIGGDQDTLLHPRHEPARMDRTCDFVGLHPVDHEDVIDLYSRVTMGAIVVVLGPNHGVSRIKSVSAQ